MAVKKTFNVIRLRENIKLGQRITSVAIDVDSAGKWLQIAAATSVGANRLIRLPQNVTADKVRLRVTGSLACIALSDFGLFKEPAHLTAPLISRDKNGLVNIATVAPVTSIHYTLNGTQPTLSSPIYKKGFLLADGGIVSALSFEINKASEVSTKEFSLSKAGWTVVNTQPAMPENAAYAIDEDENTSWKTLQKDSSAVIKYPQEITVDMGRQQWIKAFTYLPRQDKIVDGIADKYAYSVSTDGQQWQQIITGEFSNIRSNPVMQTIPLGNKVKARYFKFSILHVVAGNGVVVAELGAELN